MVALVTAYMTTQLTHSWTADDRGESAHHSRREREASAQQEAHH